MSRLFAFRGARRSHLAVKGLERRHENNIFAENEENSTTRWEAGRVLTDNGVGGWQGGGGFTASSRRQDAGDDKLERWNDLMDTESQQPPYRLSVG